MKKDLFTLLKGFPFFENVPDDQLTLFSANTQDHIYRPGEVIVAETNQAKGFFFLVSGHAKMYRSAPDGKEQTLYVFEPGDPFCLCSAFQGKPSPASVAALEESRVLFISLDAFERIAGKDPVLLFNIIRVIATRLRQAMDMIESLSLKEIPQRVATYLALLADENRGNSQPVTLPMTHRELAKIVGVTPEALSRTMKKMTEQGIIDVAGREVDIRDLDALRRCAESGL